MRELVMRMIIGKVMNWMMVSLREENYLAICGSSDRSPGLQTDHQQ